MNYKTYPIADLIDEIAMGPFGSNIKVDCFVDKGIPVLNGSNLEGFELSEKSFRYVTEEKADSLKKANAYKGDVVITHRGTLGQIVYIPQTAQRDRYVISQSQFRVKCNKKVLPEYFVYYFHTPIGQHKLLSNASQVGVPALARPSSTFQKIEIEIPDLETQRKVVKLIGSLQTRIKTNAEINDNLQQQAELLYHKRFETVNRDKLPVGWRIVRLGDVATISKKSFNPAKEPEMMLEHYSIPAFDEAHFPVFEPSTAIKSNKFIVDDSCFMISKLNPTTKRVWKPYCLTANAVCSTEFIVYKAKSQDLTDFLYSVIDSTSFSDFMCSHVTGSTGSRQRTTPSDTLAFELVLPNAEEIAEYQGVVSPMFEQIKCNAIENDRLKRLRDSLLPKLMSGELDVSSIQL
jgi:type I restriction enzyme S subunit